MALSPSDGRDSFSRWSFADLHGSMLAWVILGLSALITLAAWHVSSESVKREAEVKFRFQSADIRQAIEERMHEQEVALWGGVGLFNSQGKVSRRDWQRYAHSLRLEKYLPGLQGYGYAELVRHEDKAEHIARIRAEGYPDFDIYPEGDRPYYGSIIYLEPFRDRNLRAFGYDMFSEATRRKALERARDTGEPAVTGMVTLVQETQDDVQRGFLMYLPVYRTDLPTETVEERRAAITGIVYSPFRIKDLMRGILGQGDKEVDFRIYDGESAAADNLLYNSAEADAAYQEDGDPQFTGISIMKIGGHCWTLEFRSRAGFIPASEANEPVYVAAGGILIDILLFLTITSLTNQRRRAQLYASTVTEELRAAKEKAEGAAHAELVLRTAAQEANAKLKTANDGLLNFTSIVAHDLRSPLKRIESFVDILAEDYAEKLDAEGRDILKRTRRGSSRMRLMLDSLHNYAKFSDIAIQGKSASLRGVIRMAIETLGSEARNADIRIDCDDDIEVHGDAVLLSHVMQNLISNSIKFSGGRKPVLEIGAKRMAGGRVEISVADNGIGIEPEHAEKVFGMFTRLHNEDEYEGTGIGLAVCKKVVQDHGGRIHVDTARRKGARVVITLEGANEKSARDCSKSAA